MPSSQTLFCAAVLRREQLTPDLVRLVLGGPDLAHWPSNDATDAYLVLWFPPAGAPYAAPFQPDDVRAEHPAELWPSHRHYSVRQWDAERRELTIDFVVHGDEGIAGPWARDARPGDSVMVTSPGGGYRPDPTADWHLFVGDESALPAIARSLEAVPPESEAVVVALCDGPGAELDLPCPAPVEVRWLYRRGEPASAELLTQAVRELRWRPGRVHAFVHGEAGEVREVRRHLLADHALPKGDLSASGYWRRTMTDEAWRRVKRDWNADVARDVPEPAGR